MLNCQTLLMLSVSEPLIHPTVAGVVMNFRSAVIDYILFIFRIKILLIWTCHYDVDKIIKVKRMLMQVCT